MCIFCILYSSVLLLHFFIVKFTMEKCKSKTLLISTVVLCNNIIECVLPEISSSLSAKAP